MSEIQSDSHGGLMIPLDMIRLSALAGMLSDLFAGKARNILDAKLVVARHASLPILLMRVQGSFVGDNEAEFWRENTDVAELAGQFLPRQVFLYWAQPGVPEKRREGFIIVQRGQVMAAEDATLDRLGPNPPEEAWPVARLCQQMRISMSDLADFFPGGPRVEVPLVDAAVDDRALLMELAGKQPDGEGAEDGPASPDAATQADGAPTSPNATTQNKASDKPTATEDARRRAVVQEEEAREQRERAEQVYSNLPYALDELGAVFAPQAELSEPDILAPFIQAELTGDLPNGVPSELGDRLRGKRLDVAVRVEFLSEVFVENSPLSRPKFEETAQTVNIGGKDLRVLEVLGPRLGYGTLVSTGKSHVFVSRKRDVQLPADLVVRLLE